MPRKLALLLLLVSPLAAQEHARFGAGPSPRTEDGVHTILDGTLGASNAIGLPGVAMTGRLELAFDLHIDKGGDGGAICLLNTAEYGKQGPPPFVKDWTRPNLRRSLAVGIDVHNPKNTEPFGEWGNYLGRPEREVSLHWDGREIVKRVAPKEFRGDWAACRVEVAHVIGGAEITVEMAGAKVYDRYFVPSVPIYEARVAIGGGTRADVGTKMTVRNVRRTAEEVTAKPRPPKRFEVFNHVLTDNSKTFFEKEVELPPVNWAFGRIILTLEIHDAGPDWDEWDRNGHLSIYDDDGKKWDIVPFITSYRTECYWQVDVTHFRPWLQGKRKFEIRAGTTFYKNRGYMMSVSLDYYPGKPALEAYRIEPLWHGNAKYKSQENHFRDFFEPKSVTPGEETAALRLFTTTTGHSQIGEFVPSKRTIVAGEQRFENVLWKDDCYLNPNRPQFGTWKYARAGWAPGDIVWPWWIDLTPQMKAREPIEIRYEPTPYEFPDAEDAPKQAEINKAMHVVRAYAIFFRKPDALMEPPSLRITGVAPNTNARKAGIQRGDYIESYDGQTIRSLDDLRAALAAAAQAGKQEIPIVLYRGAKRLEKTLPPGRMGVNLSAE
ncbi:MAG: peptide-N-glycosidase F-related protein [Planctomycetota bacterium]